MPDTDNSSSSWTTARSLGMVQGINQWLERYQHTTPDGLAWGRAAEDPDRILRTLYAGSAGIAIFQLEQHKATGAMEPLTVATACGEDLVSYLQTKDQLPCAMFTGWAGYAFVLTELFKATAQDRFREAAARCLQKLAEQSSALGAGRGWIESMPFSDITGHSGEREIFDASVGAAGAGMVYLYAFEQGVYPEGLSFAEAVGNRLLEVAEPMTVGLQWRLMNDMPFDFSAPNFAHGGAGVAYYLARLYQHTGAQPHLDAAIAGAAHLQDIAFAKGDGHLICHLKEGRNPNDHFYLGQCHGPAGTARLFHLLHQITGEPAYETFAESLMRGLEATGAPEQRSYGMWNNVSQCCCDAGIGDYALFEYKTTGDEAHLKLALRVADALEACAIQDAEGIRWRQAEHRARPDFVETQTGYMQGAAGVGSFFVHLASVLGDYEAKIVFPDCPYPG